jgi:Cu(I)/Ag(I) efflux system membrane fusion protein
MDLTKVVMTEEEMRSTKIRLSEEQLLLGNIKTDTVRHSLIGEEKTLTATTTVHEDYVQLITTRVSGRIENIYFKSIGEKIIEGQKLYDIYSEELLNIQQQYLLAVEQKRKQIKGSGFNYETFINSTKNKLLLYGLTEDQIKELEEQKTLQSIIPIYSMHSGVILDINVRMGDYINEGMEILKVADLKKLWVEAQLYTHEIRELSASNTAEVTIAAFPEEQLSGKINFINLELIENTKINLVRIEIENEHMLFRPGMMAYVSIKLDEKKAIVVPSDAVIKTKNYTSVWIQNNEGSFEVRKVSVGMENNNKVEITSGLKIGEVVVVTGAYLLNSEYIFKKGADPMAGMHTHMIM